MSSPLSPAEVVEAMLAHQLLQYCAVIGPVILVYDSSLTLASEIRHIWQQPWSPLKLLYICARYLPFVDTAIMTLYRSFLSAPSIKTCMVLTSCQLWLYVIGIALSELIFMIRTWAVWKNNWTLGVVLLLIGAICLASAMFGVQEFNESMTFLTGSGVGGCLPRESNNMLLVDWSMFIVMEAVLLGLVLYRTYLNYKEGHKICKLMQVIIHDGVLYFAVLFSTFYSRPCKRP
ncbi:hypothetical protein F5I97DRAFT_39802 [Phlebopus sp. FC_14]|nr:hypothetical protein F5I97DRAFT_39802 [Phlebopus sp. FC_14]